MKTNMNVSILESLISDAQEIIRDSRKTTIYESATKVEKFLSEKQIPVNYYYDEKDFYTYNAYPITNFIDICNAYNIDVKPQINTLSDGSQKNAHEDAHCKPFIYNFIHNSHYKRFELVKFFNIFFPNTNHKFSFSVFTAPARFNKSISMMYVHPKYILEEVLHQLCLIENVNKFEELKNRFYEILADWERIEGKPAFGEQKFSHENRFDPTQINILSTISTLEIPIVRCFYDRNLPIIITNSVGVNLIEHTISSITANYERKDSTSKSFFDNRIGNTIFRIGGKQIVKVFPLLDYEIVTLSDSAVINLPNAKLRHQTTNFQMKENNIIMDCDSIIALRLAYNEYITYDIIGLNEVANNKLLAFASLYNKFGINNINIKGKVVGIYYPFEMYIKELRVKSIKKAASRNALIQYD